ncbi:MAG: metallophosphoesterase [Sandaracinaceae bacterium]
MRLAWLTDIHLDHADDAAIDALLDAVACEAPDGLLLTGDLSIAAKLPAHLSRIVETLDRPAWFVLGNHDYWGTEVEPLREVMRRIREVEPRLSWLQHAGPVPLSETTVLVGVDGWADARNGDVAGSPIRLRDYQHIGDLVRDDFSEALDVVRSLADHDATRLTELLHEARATAPTILVATHVPPFVEAARFKGQVTHPHWLPWVTCRAVGDALLAFADAHPETQLDVLCGHMHHPADERMRPNLRVRCGEAHYRRPALGALLHV